MFIIWAVNQRVVNENNFGVTRRLKNTRTTALVMAVVKTMTFLGFFPLSFAYPVQFSTILMSTGRHYEYECWMCLGWGGFSCNFTRGTDYSLLFFKAKKKLKTPLPLKIEESIQLSKRRDTKLTLLEVRSTL